MKYVRGVMFLNGQTIPVRQPITAEDFTQQFMFMKMNANELGVGTVEGYIILEDDANEKKVPLPQNTSLRSTASIAFSKVVSSLSTVWTPR